MHIVIVHGYILQGTGSNIYVANIAQAWKSQNHSVTIICQDIKAARLPFVDEYYSPGSSIPDFTPEPGTIRVIVPDINKLLPVYVMDKYDGFNARTVYSLSEKEIENHITMTSSVLSKIITSQKVDKILANHAILSPVIVKRSLKGSNIPYDVKIHGSAIEFALVHHRHLLKYAYEGFSSASRIIAGTNHIEKRIKHVFTEKLNELDIEKKLVIIPPGMDPELFTLSNSFEQTKTKFLKALALEIKESGSGRDHGKIQICNTDIKTADELHETLVNLGQQYDQRSPDSDIFRKLLDFKENEPIIIYFGKFLKTKGIGEFILNIPHILNKHPQAYFIIAGFGSYREHMEALIQSLEDNKPENAKKIARAGNFISDKLNIDKMFKPITSTERKRITVTGFLNHSVLSKLLSLSSICVVPSRLSEAFGMVAVEAMASGVLPICNNHSGLHDVMDIVTNDYNDIKDIVLTDRHRFFDELYNIVSKAIDYLYPNGFNDKSFKEEVSKKLRHISEEYFSWNKIVKELAVINNYTQGY